MYALVMTENPNKYCDSGPFLGPFNTMCDDERYIQVLQGEVLVAEGSVARALKGTYYTRVCVA